MRPFDCSGVSERSQGRLLAAEGRGKKGSHPVADCGERHYRPVEASSVLLEDVATRLDCNPLVHHPGVFRHSFQLMQERGRGGPHINRTPLQASIWEVASLREHEQDAGKQVRHHDGEEQVAHEPCEERM